MTFVIEAWVDCEICACTQLCYSSLGFITLTHHMNIHVCVLASLFYSCAAAADGKSCVVMLLALSL